MFLSLFNPWEAEAVGCIDLFIRHKYAIILHEVREELHPDSPRFRNADGSFVSERSINLYGVLEYNDYLHGTVARGLKLAIRLLAIEDHETLVNKMQRCLTPHYRQDAPMEQVLWSDTQRDRRNLSSTNDRDDAELRRDPVQFTGDAAQGPPFGWVLLWNGIYANIYGDYVPSAVQEWGYVMWDKRRWNEVGAGEDILLKEWKTVPWLVKTIEQDCGWRPAGW